MSELFSIISSGGAFKNPLTGGLSSFTSQIDTLGLTNPLNPVYAALEPSAVTDIIAAFENVVDGMGSYQSHTDILSGVNLGGENGMAAMAQIMSVARVAEGQPSCAQFNKAFGAVMKAGEVLAEIKALVDLILQLIENPEAIAEELKNRLLAFGQKMIDQIASDILAFQQAQATALANAVGEAITSLLGDSCFSNVLGAVATTEMKKKVDEIKAVKIPTISELI